MAEEEKEEVFESNRLQKLTSFEWSLIEKTVKPNLKLVYFIKSTKFYVPNHNFLHNVY